LEGVKTKLKEIEDKEGLIFTDKDMEFVKVSLRAEIEGLKAQIKRGITHKDGQA